MSSLLTHIFLIFCWTVPSVTIPLSFRSLITFAYSFESVRIDVNDALSLGRRVGIEQVDFYEI
jgi:hypothetical protein